MVRFILAFIFLLSGCAMIQKAFNYHIGIAAFPIDNTQETQVFYLDSISYKYQRDNYGLDICIGDTAEYWKTNKINPYVSYNAVLYILVYVGNKKVTFLLEDLSASSNDFWGHYLGFLFTKDTVDIKNKPIKIEFQILEDPNEYLRKAHKPYLKLTGGAYIQPQL